MKISFPFLLASCSRLPTLPSIPFVFFPSLQFSSLCPLLSFLSPLSLSLLGQKGCGLVAAQSRSDSSLFIFNRLIHPPYLSFTLDSVPLLSNTKKDKERERKKETKEPGDLFVKGARVAQVSPSFLPSFPPRPSQSQSPPRVPSFHPFPTHASLSTLPPLI
jgi:hypothetical protein